jgi:small subunit ribosomal protein S19
MNNRSKWKGFYSEEKFIKNLQNLKTPQQLVIQIISRKSTIIPKFVGKIYNVHSGKNYSKVTVLKNMIGHKFGEFVITRAKFVFKKKKKKKNR